MKKFVKTFAATSAISAATTLGFFGGVLAIGEVMELADKIKAKMNRKKKVLEED